MTQGQYRINKLNVNQRSCRPNGMGSFRCRDRYSSMVSQRENMLLCHDSNSRLLLRPEAFMFNCSDAGEQSELACHTALFAGISPWERSEILSCARVTTFARGQRLFSQDQPITQ